MSQAQKISIAKLPGETKDFCRWLDYQQVSTTEQMASIQELLKEGFPRKCHKWRSKARKNPSICDLHDNDYLQMKNYSKDWDIAD